mmetsp:Transcript_99504/g.252806  ORF Transcript_99504/g.252806 Transcript_99504/m.252806 type:complete len:358 (+) Transcript_99504:102-1175(+)
METSGSSEVDRGGEPVYRQLQTQVGQLCSEQLSTRVAHLEADIALLSRRKGELERENEALAAACARQGALEALLEDAHSQLGEARATVERLEGECRRLRAESARRGELEMQQASIASSFAELQGVVAQLVQRLTELDAQRFRLAEEKGAAEAIAAALRAELQRHQVSVLLGTASPIAAAAAAALGAGAGRPLALSPYRTSYGTSVGRPRRGEWCTGRCHSNNTRLRCRASDPTPPPRGASAGRTPVGPHSAGGGSLGNSTAAAVADVHLAEMRIQVELLRQQLLEEQHARARARQVHEDMIQDAAESKTELQNELRQVLAMLSARGGGSDDDGSGGRSAAATQAWPPHMRGAASSTG